MRNSSIPLLIILSVLIHSNNGKPLPKEEDETLDLDLPSCPLIQPSDFKAIFTDTFKDLKKWTHSKDSKYNGKFLHRNGKYKSDNQVFKSGENCNGMIIPKEAQHYAISTSFKQILRVSDSDFVVQYGVRTHNSLECGGAYIKLIQNESPNEMFKPASFNDETPYSIMFGPDRCGSKNKIHFIFRFKNPVSGEFTEHHLRNAPEMPSGQRSHIYTLLIRKNGKFEIFIDFEKKSSGSLLEDFDPPVNPNKTVDDPNDVKPEDWVDEEKIPDPEAKKPKDWNEEAPMEIEDPEATKPENWDEEAPLQIVDPEAKEPKDWNSEFDGDWEAPIIPNPKCQKSGCGKWIHPKIPNPNFKGKWIAPQIENPNFKGIWKPKQIENRNYFSVSKVELKPIGGIGIEVWTMQKDIEFFDFFLANGMESLEEAKRFADKTFFIRNEAEDKIFPKQTFPQGSGKTDYFELAQEYLFFVRNFVEENYVLVLTIIISVLPLLFFICCSRKKRNTIETSKADQSEILDETTQIIDSDDELETGSDIVFSEENLDASTTGIGEESLDDVTPRRRRTRRDD